MYNYINKILVNQTNTLYRQPGLIYKMFCQDRDISSNKTKSLPKTCHNYVQIWEDAAPLNIRTINTNTTRKYSTINRSFDNLDILQKYYSLIANKRSFSTLNGRVSKRSLRPYQQVRGYPSFFKKIAGFFKAKPLKKKKSQCKQVLCSTKSTSKTQRCVKKPPPNINFKKAMECEEKIVKKEREEFQIVCPQKVEVGHKEKPPFESEGGQFVEDRLCKEMPEKRCQRIMEEQDMKQEEQNEICESKKQEKIKSKKNEIKTCVKNKKKENSCKENAHPLDTCKEEPKRVCNNPVRELDCIVTDVKSECKQSKHPKAKKYKVGDVKFQCKIKRECTQTKTEDIKACPDVDKMQPHACAPKLECAPTKTKEECTKNKSCARAAKSECATIKVQEECAKNKCKNTKSCTRTAKPECAVAKVQEECSKNKCKTAKSCTATGKSKCDALKVQKECSKSKCKTTRSCTATGKSKCAAVKVQEECSKDKCETTDSCTATAKSKCAAVKVQEECSRNKCETTDSGAATAKSKCAAVKVQEECSKSNCETSDSCTATAKSKCAAVKVQEECSRNKCETTDSCASTAKSKCAAVKVQEDCTKNKCRNTKSCTAAGKSKSIAMKVHEECSKNICETICAGIPKSDCVAEKDQDECSKDVCETNKSCNDPREELACKAEPKLDCAAAKTKKKCPKFKFECNNTRSVEKMLTCSELKEKAKSATEVSCEDTDSKGDKCRMTKPCNVKRKDDDCKKPPKGGCGGCDSGDSSSNCGGSSKCGDALNCSPIQQEELPIPLVPNNSPISLAPIYANEVMERILVKPSDRPKLFPCSSSLTNILYAYSKVDLQLNKSRIISINLDAVNQEDNLPDLSRFSKRKFLEPSPNSARLFQTRDSRSTSLSTSSLSKIFKTKYPMRHILGRIPIPPSTLGECPVFPLHNLHTNKNYFLRSSEPDAFDLNDIRTRYYSNIPTPTYPQVDPRQRIEQRDPSGTVKLQEPETAAAIGDCMIREKVEDHLKRDNMFLSDSKSNNNDKNASGNGSNNTNNNNSKNNGEPEDKCKTEKPPCPSTQPCCKMDKSKCDMAPEELKKVLPSCKSGSCGIKASIICGEVCPKPEKKKKDSCFDPKDCKLCNFDQAVQAEKKVKEEKLCVVKLSSTEDVCPIKKKKQLCCYQKKEKPKMPVNPCCITQEFPKDFECALCKKFQVLDLPTKPKRKLPVCKLKKCGAPKGCPSKIPPSNVCKKLAKRPNVFCPKCPKPKFKEEPPKRKTKEIASIARCSKSPCYQKKCTKKKPPKAPCPTPIRPPKFDDKKKGCPPIPCNKTAKPVDEATRKRMEKMCAKPTKRRQSDMKCAKEESDCDKKKMNKKVSKQQQQEREEKEAKEQAYAQMKHTDWRAVPVRGDNRWCKEAAVERNEKCKEELSKTVLPSTEEKYRSPRYQSCERKGSSGPKPCKNKTNKPNVRKMSSYPGLEHVPMYNIGRVFSCVNLKTDTPKIKGSRSWDDLASDKNQD